MHKAVPSAGDLSAPTRAERERERPNALTQFMSVAPKPHSLCATQRDSSGGSGEAEVERC